MICKKCKKNVEFENPHAETTWLNEKGELCYYCQVVN
jgi:hypothetical protein